VRKPAREVDAVLS